MIRLIQYAQRIANVVLFAWPGQYRKRKLQILEEMFQLSIKALQGTNEPFWLDFGTLLGQYRHKGIIPHDIDVDVAMMEDSYEKVKELKTQMPKGLMFYDTSHKHDGPKVYFSYKGFDFDIFFYQSQESTIQCYLNTHHLNEIQKIPKDLVFPAKDVEFLGMKVGIPNNTKGYLEKMYGYIGEGGTRDKTTGLWNPPSD